MGKDTITTMNVFKTLNSTIEKSAYTIKIANIDASAYHWGSEKQIACYLDEVENFLYDKENFDKNMILHAIELVKSNTRIQDLKFYSIPENNEMLLLATTNVRKFKETDPFSRKISIEFKKHKFVFSIIEVLEEEKKQKDFAIPSNWKLEEKLQRRFSLMNNYAF